MKAKTLINLITFGIFLMIITTACQTTGPLKVKETTLKDSNLYEVVDSRVRVAYLDPDVDFFQYKKILVRPLNFEKTRIDENYDTTGVRRRYEFELNEKDKAAKYYQKGLELSLQNG